MGATVPAIARPELLDGSFHHHLLKDHARLDGYARAIAATVREGDVVADIGAGSGILSWLAAQAGASRVHAVETNTNSYRALMRTVQRNRMTGRIVPTLSDGTQWIPKEPVDVVVCELIETGLLHEPIAAVARHLDAWPTKPRAFLPRTARLLVEGVEVREEFHGYRVRLPGFRATGGDPAATDAVPYADYDFLASPPGERVEATFTLTATRDAQVNGLQLRTETEVAPGIVLGESPGYCTPVVLTLDDAIPVRKGDRLDGTLAYDFDYTNEPITFDLRRA